MKYLLIIGFTLLWVVTWGQRIPIESGLERANQYNTIPAVTTDSSGYAPITDTLGRQRYYHLESYINDSLNLTGGGDGDGMLDPNNDGDTIRVGEINQRASLEWNHSGESTFYDSIEYMQWMVPASAGTGNPGTMRLGNVWGLLTLTNSSGGSALGSAGNLIHLWELVNAPESPGIWVEWDTSYDPDDDGQHAAWKLGSWGGDYWLFSHKEKYGDTRINLGIDLETGKWTLPTYGDYLLGNPYQFDEPAVDRVLAIYNDSLVTIHPDSLGGSGGGGSDGNGIYDGSGSLAENTTVSLSGYGLTLEDNAVEMILNDTIGALDTRITCQSDGLEYGWMGYDNGTFGLENMINGSDVDLITRGDDAKIKLINRNTSWPTTLEFFNFSGKEFQIEANPNELVNLQTGGGDIFLQFDLDDGVTNVLGNMDFTTGTVFEDANNNVGSPGQMWLRTASGMEWVDTIGLGGGGSGLGGIFKAQVLDTIRTDTAVLDGQFTFDASAGNVKLTSDVGFFDTEQLIIENTAATGGFAGINIVSNYRNSIEMDAPNLNAIQLKGTYADWELKTHAGQDSNFVISSDYDAGFFTITGQSGIPAFRFDLKESQVRVPGYYGNDLTESVENITHLFAIDSTDILGKMWKVDKWDLIDTTFLATQNYVDVNDDNDIDYVSNVTLNGTDLEFTGTGNAFNSTVDLSSLSGGGSPDGNGIFSASNDGGTWFAQEVNWDGSNEPRWIGEGYAARINWYDYSDGSSWHSPGFSAYRADGTESSPTNVDPGDRVFGFTGRMWQDGDWRLSSAFTINAGSQWGVGNYHTNIAFNTVEDGGTSQGTRFMVDGSDIRLSAYTSGNKQADNAHSLLGMRGDTVRNITWEAAADSIDQYISGGGGGSDSTIVMYQSEESTTLSGSTDYPFSMGNGDTFTGSDDYNGWGWHIHSDGRIKKISVGSQTGCTLGGEITVYKNETSTGVTLDIGASATYASSDVNIAVSAGDVINFKVTDGCATGGQGAVAFMSVKVDVNDY